MKERGSKSAKGDKAPNGARQVATKAKVGDIVDKVVVFVGLHIFAFNELGHPGGVGQTAARPFDGFRVDNAGGSGRSDHGAAQGVGFKFFEKLSIGLVYFTVILHGLFQGDAGENRGDSCGPAV